MSQGKRKRRRKWLTQAQKRKLLSLLTVAVVICAAWFFTQQGQSIDPLLEYFPFLEEIFPQEKIPASAPAASGENLRVHILDVGQADCILIQGPEKTMVIDGGESSDAPDIIQYLRDQGVERIDYYLNTHPHSDHYGGIIQVMEAITRCRRSTPPPPGATRSSSPTLPKARPKPPSWTRGTWWRWGTARC